MGMRVSVVAVVRVVAVDKLDVGDRTAVIVEKEPLTAELVAGIELDAAAVLDPAVIVENEPLTTELVAGVELDVGTLDTAGELDSTELVESVELVGSVELDAAGVFDPAVIVENEPLTTELVAGSELDTDVRLDTTADVLLVAELGTGTELLDTDVGLDAMILPDDDTMDDEPVVDPGEGPVAARMRIPTAMLLEALEIACCEDRR